MAPLIGDQIATVHDSRDLSPRRLCMHSVDCNDCVSKLFALNFTGAVEMVAAHGCSD